MTAVAGTGAHGGRKRLWRFCQGGGGLSPLIVQQEQGQETPVICYYEPMKKISYNYSEDRDDPACEMALLFLQAEGGMRFNGSFWLDRATATDFAPDYAVCRK